MSALFICLFLIGLASEDPCKGHAAGHVLSADSEEVDHGFRVVRREVCNAPDFWESVGHFDYFFYKDRELGQVGYWSVSPSGRYALFEGIGKLLLFDARNDSLKDVTDGEFAIPKNVTWREKELSVEVVYYEGHLPSKIQTPK